MNMSTRVNNPNPTTVRRSVIPDVAGLGGAVAGLIGGIAMAIVGSIIAVAIGEDPWSTPKHIAAMVLGNSATATPGFVFGPVLVGSILHFLMSAVLGAIFGILVRRVFHWTSDFGAPVIAGLIYGATVWLVAYFIVLPIVNPSLLSIYAPGFIIQNLVYGVVTGLAHAYLRPEPYRYRDDNLDPGIDKKRTA